MAVPQNGFSTLAFPSLETKYYSENDKNIDFYYFNLFVIN
jgi:hypothetical protein